MYTDRVPEQQRVERKSVAAEQIILQPGDATRYIFIVSFNWNCYPELSIALFNFSTGQVSLTFDASHILAMWREIKDLDIREQIKTPDVQTVQTYMPLTCNNIYTARAIIEAGGIFLENCKEYPTEGGDM